MGVYDYFFGPAQETKTEVKKARLEDLPANPHARRAFLHKQETGKSFGDENREKVEALDKDTERLNLARAKQEEFENTAAGVFARKVIAFDKDPIRVAKATRKNAEFEETFVRGHIPTPGMRR